MTCTLPVRVLSAEYSTAVVVVMLAMVTFSFTNNKNRKLKMSRTRLPVCYFSIDVETDGPSPIVNSMVAIGVVVMIRRVIVEEWSRTISPIPDHKQDHVTMREFWEKHPRAWEATKKDTVSPAQAMHDLATLVAKYQKTHKVHWVALPSCVDWMFLKSYYEAYSPPKSPEIGYYCADVRSMISIYSEITGIQPHMIVRSLTAGHITTHRPVDDARRQAILFRGLIDLIRWI